MKIYTNWLSDLKRERERVCNFIYNTITTKKKLKKINLQLIITLVDRKQTDELDPLMMIRK